jgi:outer membrane receptor protein involved in Fe transport
MTNKPVLWLIAALLSLPLPSVAADILDEIIVSADFRGRSLDDVPFSVSVLDAETINATAVQHFEELINIVPNMNWSGDGHRARYFQIRGVGELEQYQGAPNPSIGFIIDDIDFSGIGSVATLFDVQSVEVLRGPQGSRYGANALGGLIYVQSAAPTEDSSGLFELSTGSDDTRSIGAALGGALNASGTSRFRISAQQYASDGFRHNSFLGRDDSNGRDELSLRAGLQFAPSESVAAKLAFVYSNIDNGYDAFALDNSYTVLSDKPGKDAQESLGASARFDWAGANELAFTSITSLASSDITFSFDADWGNDDSWAPFVYDYVSLTDRERDTISQEFRLGNERWMLGVYALNLEEGIQSINLGDYFDPFFDFADSLDDRFASSYEATSVAVFGQADLPLGDSMELGMGLRIERRTTDYNDSVGVAAAPSETMWGGEISLSREMANAVRVYVSLSKGYKAGGFNLGPTPAGKQDFDAEQMYTLEAGAKGALLDDRLQMSAAVFHNVRPDQQVRSATQLVPGDPASFVFFTDNVGEGDALGLEADIRYLINDAWEFYATVGLLDASFESGREQAHAPGFTFAAGLSYRSVNGLFARLDLTAKDDFYFDINHDQQSEAFELLNARVGYESEDWMISAWVRNLMDEDYAVRGFYFGNEPPNFPNTLYTRLGDPRQYGVTFEWRY